RSRQHEHDREVAAQDRHLGVLDVHAVVEQHARHGRHDPRAVVSRGREQERAHGATLTQEVAAGSRRSNGSNPVAGGDTSEVSYDLHLFKKDDGDPEELYERLEEDEDEREPTPGEEAELPGPAADPQAASPRLPPRQA